MRETNNRHEISRRAAVRSLLAALLAAALLAGCVTAGRTVNAPDWVFETPRPDATDTWFVGQSSLDGTVGEAFDDAAASLAAAVVQYLGVTVTVETSAEARATLDSYRADISQKVRTEASGRLAGFQVRSRYVDLDRKTGRRTVYLLASYATQDLEREKARIAALFRERDDAVSKPEAEARSLALAGRGQDALMSYIHAALAASSAGVENAEAKQSRNLAAARALASRMRFIANTGVVRVDSGEAFPAPFVLRLVIADGAGGVAGVPGARLLVGYARSQGSRLGTKTVSAVTDDRGLLSFLPPPPDFVGAARLQVRLDCQDALDLLAGLPARSAAEAAAIESALRAIAVELPYESLSRARSVPTALLVLDSGTAMEGSGQAALAAALSRAGFNLRPAGFAAVQAAGAALDETAILASARLAAPASGYARLAYGLTALQGVRRDGESWIAEARASVKVVELASGALLYAGDRVAQAPGADEASASRAAVAEACAVLAQDLLSTLP